MARIYTLAELRRFIALHDRLNDDDLTKDEAIRFHQLGWIVQVDLAPARWAITDLGRHQVDNPPPANAP